MDAEPSRLTPAGDPAQPPARPERWHAALTRLVAPKGRPIRKTLLLAPAFILLVDVPLVLLSAALSLSPPREAPPVTGRLIAGLIVVAPVLETWLVIGLHCGAAALARAVLRGSRHGGAAGFGQGAGFSFTDIMDAFFGGAAGGAPGPTRGPRPRTRRGQDALIRIEVELVQDRGKVCKFAGKVLIDGALAAEASFTAMIADAPTD